MLQAYSFANCAKDSYADFHTVGKVGRIEYLQQYVPSVINNLSPQHMTVPENSAERRTQLLDDRISLSSGVNSQIRDGFKGDPVTREVRSSCLSFDP